MPLPKELDERIRKRFGALLEEGESFEKSGEVDAATLTAFRISVSSLASLILVEPNRDKVLGELERLALNPFVSEYFAIIFGILKGLRSDYESGILDNLNQMVEANVTYDFMGQAEQLLAGERHDFDHVPAAVLVGAVLEDAVRRLSQRQDPTLETERQDDSHRSLDWMIAELQKRNAFSKAKADQLRSWAKIRNSAAHGRFGEFTRSDAEQMIAGIKIFLADYL